MYNIVRSTQAPLRQLRHSAAAPAITSRRRQPFSDDVTSKPTAAAAKTCPPAAPASTATTVPIENPIARTMRLLRGDMRTIKNFILPPTARGDRTPASDAAAAAAAKPPTLRQMADRQQEHTDFQSNCDVLIIGGGGVGSSIAYWLKKRAFGGLNVVVLEKDPTVSAWTRSRHRF